MADGGTFRSDGSFEPGDGDGDGEYNQDPRTMMMSGLGLIIHDKIHGDSRWRKVTLTCHVRLTPVELPEHLAGDTEAESMQFDTVSIHLGPPLEKIP